jgi:hypothetical protein
VALVRKTDGQRNFRNRKVRAVKQFLGTFNASSGKVVAWRHAFRLLKHAREMRGRQARDIGERVESDCLAKMRVDIFVNSPQDPWRKPNPKAQDRRTNPPSCNGSDRYQLARFDCECPNCQLLPITQRHDPYLLGRSSSLLHTPIELFAVDLNQKAGGVRYSIVTSARGKSAGSSSPALWRS